MRKAQTVITEARLQQLRTMPYAEYVQTPEWQARHKKALQEACGRCQFCNRDENQLSVYHQNDAHRGCEQQGDLLVVCEECHDKFSRSVVQSRSLLEQVPLSGAASHWLVGGGTAALLVPIMDFAMQWGVFGVILGGGVSAAVGYVWGPQIMRFLQRRGIATPALPRLSGETWERLTQPTYPVDTQAARPAITVESSVTTLPDEQNSLYPRTNRNRIVRFNTSHGEVHELEQLLEDVLTGFQIHARVEPEATVVGPRIIGFGVVPTGTPQMEGDLPKRNEKGHIVYAKRTRIKEITDREKDIQLALGAASIRILSPVPGKRYVGIEIPNPKPCMVTLAEVLESPEYRQASASSKLVVALGRDVSGHVRFCDIEKAPHLLIAGTTNAGKSVLLNVLIASLLNNATPDEVRLLLVDPKMVEFTPYNGIAHLLKPVLTDMRKVVTVLDDAITEMDRRYRIFVELGVKKLSEYRKKREQMPHLENLPSWVIIIDEFADLMMTAADETEEKVIRLAQKARATGIHLILATQKPLVEVVTSLIKGNLPTKIALKTANGSDSRVILDSVGAEKLLGNGDMLYHAADSEVPIRIQGAYMTDADTQALVSRWRIDAPAASHWDESVATLKSMRTESTGQRPLDTETIRAWYQTGRIGQTQFLILHKEIAGKQSETSSRPIVEAPPVPEQTLARIREMKARRYDDEDIIVLVGLRNNPALYQQALSWLEHHPVEPETKQGQAYVPPPKLERPAYKYEEYYEVTEEAYRLGYTGKRKLADFIREHGKSFKVEPVGENKALHIIKEMRDRGMLIDEEPDESEEEHDE